MKCRRLACVNVEMCCEKALMALPFGQDHENGVREGFIAKRSAQNDPQRRTGHYVGTPYT